MNLTGAQARNPLLKVPLRQKLAYLLFTAFYFVRWFVGPMSDYELLLNIAAYVAFVAIYFYAFEHPEHLYWTVPFMLALSFIVAPHNYGANSFAIFACVFVSYQAPPQRALYYTLGCLAAMLLATLIFDLHIFYYFTIGAIIGLGLGVSAIFERQKLDQVARDLNSLEEIQRLAKLAERERIGRDLHDLLGHSLTAINLKAQLALELLKQNKVVEAIGEVEHVHRAAMRAIREVRVSVDQSSSHSLEEELSAQKEFAESLGLEVRYKLNDVLLPRHIEGHLLMIVRETINNALKHAKASRYEFDLQSGDSGIKVIIKDNGRGADAGIDQTGGHGIHGMEQRVRMLNGEWTLEMHGQFRIEIWIPWVPTDD